jgi:hypothetical protein
VPDRRRRGRGPALPTALRRGQTQLWRTGLNPSQAGAWTIRSVYSGLYVDVSGDSAWPGVAIDTWSYNGQDNQYFGSV